MRNGKFEGYLLVADFDDTFCPEHGAPVPEENRRAAQHFMDEGGLFTIATGRDVRSYYSIRDKFTVNAPLVLSNGAVIFDGESGESWYESFLPFSCRSDLLAARDAFPGTGMEVHRGADVRVCGSNATLEKHLSRMGVPVSEADPGHILYPWTKVVLVAPDEIRAEIERVVPVMKQGGGYIFASDHSIPDNISLDNFKLVLETLRRVGSY